MTTTLQALYKSQPIDTAEFDEGLDYPSHKTRELSATSATIEVTRLTYELDKDNIEAVEEHLGPGALAYNRITVHSGYRYKRRPG